VVGIRLLSARAETELGAACGGQDDRVWHIQTVLLAQQHGFTSYGVIKGQAGEDVKPGLNDFGFAWATPH